jgi:hypothetical protein
VRGAAVAGAVDQRPPSAAKRMWPAGWRAPGDDESPHLQALPSRRAKAGAEPHVGYRAGSQTGPSRLITPGPPTGGCFARPEGLEPPTF